MCGLLNPNLLASAMLGPRAVPFCVMPVSFLVANTSATWLAVQFLATCRLAESAVVDKWPICHMISVTGVIKRTPLDLLNMMN
jgi:hypothetical protein